MSDHRETIWRRIFVNEIRFMRSMRKIQKYRTNTLGMRAFWRGIMDIVSTDELLFLIRREETCHVRDIFRRGMY